MDAGIQNLAESLRTRKLARAIAKIAQTFAPICIHFIDWIIAQKPDYPVRFILRDAKIFFETAKTLADASPKYRVCADWTADYFTHNMKEHIPHKHLQTYLHKNWNESMTLVDIGCEGELIQSLENFFPDNDYQPLFFGSENPGIPGFLNETFDAQSYLATFRKVVARKKLATYENNAAVFAILMEQFPKKEISPHTLCHRHTDGMLYIMNDFHQFTLCLDESKPYLCLQNPGLPKIEPTDSELHLKPANKFLQAAHYTFFESLRAAVAEYGNGTAQLPALGDAIKKICRIAPSLMNMKGFYISSNENGFDIYEQIHKKDIVQILKVR
jgi:hypothetical protein